MSANHVQIEFLRRPDQITAEHNGEIIGIHFRGVRMFGELAKEQTQVSEDFMVDIAQTAVDELFQPGEITGLVVLQART